MRLDTIHGIQAAMVLGIMMSTTSMAAAQSDDSWLSEAGSEQDEAIAHLDLDDVIVETGTQALVHTAKMLAEETGTSRWDAMKRLRFQQSLGDFLSSTELPDNYAGLVLGDDPQGSAILYFKGDVKDAFVQDLQRQRSLRGKTETIGGQAFSLDELIAMQEQAHAAALDSTSDGTSVVSNIDLRSQSIEIEVARPASLSRQAVDDSAANRFSDEIEAQAIGGVRRWQIDEAGTEGSVLPEIVVKVVPTDGNLIELDHGYGGSEFRIGNNVTCTSAFVVRGTTTGREYVLTASHCEGLNTLAHGDGHSFSAPFFSEHIGNWGDIEIHTTTDDDFPEFYRSNNVRRTVTGRIANNAMGEDTFICRYGRRTGEDCGFVDAINTQATFVYLGREVTASNMVDIRNCTGDGGDSGGPVYDLNTAWGIHTGSRISNGSCVFSKIQNAEIFFGVRIETQDLDG